MFSYGNNIDVYQALAISINITYSKQNLSWLDAFNGECPAKRVFFVYNKNNILTIIVAWIYTILIVAFIEL